MHGRVAPRTGPATMLRAGLLEGIVVATAGGAAHVASRAARRSGRPRWRSTADLDDEEAARRRGRRAGARGHARVRRRRALRRRRRRDRRPRRRARPRLERDPRGGQRDLASRARAASSCSSARARATAPTRARLARRWRTRRARCRSSGRATRSAPRAVLPGDATSDEDVAALDRLPRLAGRRLLQRLRVHARRGRRLALPRNHPRRTQWPGTVRGHGRDRPADRRGVRVPRRRRERPEVQLAGARDPQDDRRAARRRDRLREHGQGRRA